MDVRLNAAIFDMGAHTFPPLPPALPVRVGAGKITQKEGSGTESHIWTWFKEKIKWVQANDVQRALMAKARNQLRADNHAGKVLVAMLDCRERPASTARIKNRLERMQKHAQRQQAPDESGFLRRSVDRGLRGLSAAELTSLRDGFFGDENIIPRADVQKKYKAGPKREHAKQGMRTIAAAVHDEFARRTMADSIRGLAGLANGGIHGRRPPDLQPHLLTIGARIEVLKQYNPVQGARPRPEQHFLRSAIADLEEPDLARLRYVLFGAPLSLGKMTNGISAQDPGAQVQLAAGMAAVHDGLKAVVRDEISSRIAAQAQALVPKLDAALNRMFANLAKPAALLKFDEHIEKLPKNDRSSARHLAEMATQLGGAFEMHLVSTHAVAVANLPPHPELSRRSTSDMNRYQDAVHCEREAVRKVFRDFDHSIWHTANELGIYLFQGLPQELLLAALKKTDFLIKNPGMLPATQAELDRRRSTQMPSVADGRLLPTDEPPRERAPSLPKPPGQTRIYEEPRAADEFEDMAPSAEGADKRSHRREDSHFYHEIS